MNDAGAIALKFRAIRVARLGVFASARFARFFGKRREYGVLGRLHFFARFAVRNAHDKGICQRSRACYWSILQFEKSKVNMPKKTSPRKQVTSERLQQLGFAYAPPLIISAAVSNNVFDTLENAAKTVEQVSKETGASVRGLRAIMDTLVGLELLKKDRNGKYSLTPESEAFLISNKPGTVAGFFRSILPQLNSRWLRLSEAVRNGRPVVAVNQEAEGTEFFSELVENIIPMSYPGAQTLGDYLKLAKAKDDVRVLDLAAGSGIWGIALAQRSPQVRVTAVDWAGMIPTTKRVTEKFGVRDRFDFVEGDLLEADFGKGYDIATLGHILHSEGEPRSRQLLKKTFGALKPDGTIVVAEWLVNDRRTEPTHSLMFAVQMLVNTECGDTFSFNEIKSWLEDAGFKKVRKLEAPGPSPLILATKHS